MRSNLPWIEIPVEDREVRLQAVKSATGPFSGAFRYGDSTEQGDVMILHAEEVQFHTRLPEPRSIGISNTGDLVVADWITYGESTGADVIVFDAHGDEQYHRHIAGSSPLVDISPEGSHIVICPYEDPALIVELESGETRAFHEYNISSRLLPTFRPDEDREYIDLSEQAGDPPLYRIDLDGNIVWESDEFGQREYYQVVSLSSSLTWEPTIQKFASDYEETADEKLKNVIANKIGDARLVEASLKQLTEIVRVLETYRSVFTAKTAHKKLVSQTLGNAQYRRAKALAKDKGTSAEFWTALEIAGAEYCEVLPWYEGKTGVAKVLRYQAKRYRKQQRHAEAFDCYRQIEALGKRYELELTSDADIRRSEEYRRQGISNERPAEFGRLVSDLSLFA